VSTGTKDAWVSQGETAAQSSKDSLLGVKSGIPNSFSSTPTDIGDWTVSAGGFSFDLNPLGHGFDNVAAVCKTMLTWFVTACYMLGCIMVVKEAMYAAAASNQAQAASSTPFISSGTALVMAGAITVALAAIPALLATQVGGVVSVIAGSPFSGAGGPMGMAIGLANAFIPLDLIITDVLLYIGFRVTVGALFWVSTTVVRFLVG